MQACAVDGSIIIINVTEIRSDAIIVSSSAVKTLMLPKLSASSVKSWIGRKWTGPESERGKRNRKYLEYLSWLWEACVKLVLEEIGMRTKSPEETLPRLWWIGTGLASSMPFHAAGKHSPGSTENVYHMAISSYTPSMRALAHSRDRMRCQSSTENGLLIATMKTTPGYNDLPGVITERDRALRATTGLVATVPLDQPSVDEVLESLRRCSIAHFACHGYTDHVDPSNSGLVFQKKEGCELPQQDILTVHKVFEVDSKQARIAYLSACSTAENKVAQLADEVIHVVSGFQVAGYAHVIGCLWPSGDEICADVAEGFYSSLFRHGGESWGSREVAMALRDAVIGVKASIFKQPLSWAPFVHYGA
jgi:CHAT domain-containing protein